MDNARQYFSKSHGGAHYREWKLILSYGFKLLAFNLIFVVLIWQSTYFPGWDLVASLVYIGLLIQQLRYLTLQGLGRRRITWIAVIGQLPGLVLEILALWAWIRYGPTTTDFDFLLQMWHTPWVPLTSLTGRTLFGYTFTYLFMYLVSPLFVLVFAWSPGLLAGLHRRRVSEHDRYKYRYKDKE